MDDVGVIENRLRGKFLSTNQHAVDPVARQAIASDQGSLVGQVLPGGS